MRERYSGCDKVICRKKNETVLQPRVIHDKIIHHRLFSPDVSPAFKSIQQTDTYVNIAGTNGMQKGAYGNI